MVFLLRPPRLLCRCCSLPCGGDGDDDRPILPVFPPFLWNGLYPLLLFLFPLVLGPPPLAGCCEERPPPKLKLGGACVVDDVDAAAAAAGGGGGGTVLLAAKPPFFPAWPLFPPK